MIFTALVVGAGAGLGQRRAHRVRAAGAVHRHAGDAWSPPAVWPQKISGKLTQIVNVNRPSTSSPSRRACSASRCWSSSSLVVAALGWVLLNRTTFGRRTVAIGGNPEAARLAGINVRRHTVLLYALSGLCCGIAADHGDLARPTPARPTTATSTSCDAIAAAIIGGTALTGGRGTIVGSVLGVLVFTQITNLFVVNNLQPEYQLIVQGAIIVGAVLHPAVPGHRAAASRRWRRPTDDRPRHRPPTRRRPPKPAPRTSTYAEPNRAIASVRTIVAPTYGRAINAPINHLIHDQEVVMARSPARPVPPATAARWRRRRRRRAASPRCTSNKDDNANTDTRPDQASTAATTPPPGKARHDRLLRAGRRPRLDPRHHRQRQQAGRRSTPT